SSSSARSGRDEAAVHVNGPVASAGPGPIGIAFFGGAPGGAARPEGDTVGRVLQPEPAEPEQRACTREVGLEVQPALVLETTVDGGGGDAARREVAHGAVPGGVPAQVFAGPGHGEDAAGDETGGDESGAGQLGPRRVEPQDQDHRQERQEVTV